MSTTQPFLARGYNGFEAEEDEFVAHSLSTNRNDNAGPAPTDAAWATAFKINVAITLLSVRGLRDGSRWVERITCGNSCVGCCAP